jgi:pyruvate, water dikinase
MAATTQSSSYVRWFKDLRNSDIALVGGKNASLGEMYAQLTAKGVRIPNGFALTAQAYRDALTEAGAWPKLHELLDTLDKTDVAALERAAVAAREIVYEATGTETLRRAVIEAYHDLETEAGPNVPVAVRSSATAEDLPTASFAGQHDTYLNIRGTTAVFEACRRCFASLFTDRAISYRVDNGFDHFKVLLSVGVMRMIRSDRAAAGVIFTIDTESGFRDVVFITGAYGLGENVVQGQVDPDEWYVHKPTFKQGYRCVLRRSRGEKRIRMIYGRAGGTEAVTNVETPRHDRMRFCLTDAEVLELAGYAMTIEDHYTALAGEARPMDIEWAKDGPNGELFIVQARPETVASRRDADALETYTLKGTGKVLATGKSVGDRIASGHVRVIRDAHDLVAFKPGEVLVAESTKPDWEPVMKTAGAIVTDHGGRTCHAAIVARELGVPAVVGSDNATRVLTVGQEVTVSCAEGDIGRVYEGALPFEVSRLPISAIPVPKTHVMLNLGNPEMAFSVAMRPHQGVGLARLEFIITEQVRAHPMALAHPEAITDAKVRAEIMHLTEGYESPAEFAVQKMAEGVGTICAAFAPKPVILRLSDFKSNEYAALLGGAQYEPKEENPMIGFRGASRYAHPAYADGFALECAAMRRVRDEMGLKNLLLMIPFCRRVEEAQRVIEVMAKHGLKRGEDGLEIYIMCEIPNNVVQIDAFAKLFDGFSIGSNDLTQLTLGVDRDSSIVAFDFDERDPGVKEMLRQAVVGAHRNGRHVGICGEAPANYPEIAEYLVGLGIDSISVNPNSVLKTMQIAYAAEQRQARAAAE